MATRTKSLDREVAVSTNGDEAHEVEQSGPITIERIRPKILEVTIVGVTALVVHAWSQKAKMEMLDKQTGKASKAKAARNPDQEYKDALYVSEDGWTGLPAGGVKGCLVNACRAVGKDLPMTKAKRFIFVEADGVSKNGGKPLVRIWGEHVRHDEECRLPNGNATPRFRPRYDNWELRLKIHFLENLISKESLCNLLEVAGFCEGLCEHRPGSPKSTTGDRGRFCIKASE
jgi:hypothetical protein